MHVDSKIRELCKKVTAKRPRTVIDHILKHGQVTTEELQQIYGYDHPPRAARDVREQGIPLKTIRVVSERTGRKIGAYVFDDPSKIKRGRIGGRKAFSKKFKNILMQHYESREAFTGEKMQGVHLQIDHLIPYEVAGDDAYDESNPDEYMLLDVSSQRAKSWSCESCDNWQNTQSIDICRSCFWAFPESYTHVALHDVRRVYVQWEGKEVKLYDALESRAKKEKRTINALIKEIVRIVVDDK